MARESIVRCDFCQSVIDTSKPWPTISYPLTPEQQEALLPKPPGHALLQLVVSGAPTVRLFDACFGCTDGVLPMLAELAAKSVQQALQRREGATVPPFDEDDEL